MQETQSYLFILEETPDAKFADLTINESRLEALRVGRADSAAWRWAPGFHAGAVEAELRFAGRHHRFTVIVDPDVSKLTKERFDLMVREILEDTFALFDLSGFRKSIAKGQSRKPPPIARLEFIRSRIDKIGQAVGRIIGSPRRWLSATDEWRPYHRVSRVTGPEILRSMRSGRLLREKRVPPSLPPSLHGFLPQSIRVRRPRTSLDLIEHRQILACLRYWSDWLKAVEGILLAQTANQDVDAEASHDGVIWARRCRTFARKLDGLAANEFFSEVGEVLPRLTLTQIFRSDPKYREFYRIWQDMNLALASVFGEFLALPLSRTFDLYELWCFLRLVRAASEEFGTPVLSSLFDDDGGRGVTFKSGAVSVALSGGWSISFQRQYQEFWLAEDRVGSFSRRLTPDIVISRSLAPAPAIPDIVILDAKYRVDSDLADAISSIHTYRDGLVTDHNGITVRAVRAAYVLTPYTPSFGATYEETPMPGRLFHRGYRAKFRFGAVSLMPGMSSSELRCALKQVLADAGL